MSDHRIPVTLLTGFLGAGKTTVLNAILSDETSARIAVIVNEFGEAGLDHDLIETSSDDIILMSSGCLCCTVRGELADTITGLLARRKAGDFDFDRIVIETTGLADPGPISQTMLIERALAQSTKMDGIVTIVDAVNGSATLDAQFEAVSQAAMADLIVMSKTDLVSSEQVATFEKRLRSLNSLAPIVPAVRGQNIVKQVWGLSGMREGVTPSHALSWVAPPTLQSRTIHDPLANLSGFDPISPPSHTFSPHDTRIVTASIILEEPLTDQVFDTWLNALAARRGQNLLRVKGIVFLEGIAAPFVLHGVQQIFDPPVQIRDWPEGDQRSRIVVIARDIPLFELESSLDMLRPTGTY